MPENITRVLALYDAHWPLTVPALASPNSKSPKDSPILRFIADWKPNICLFGGDNMDLGAISHWNKGKIQLIEGKRLSRDFDGFNKFLDAYDKVVEKSATEKITLTGNHEAWLDDAIEENPQMLDGMIGWEKNLHMKERGYKIISRRKIYKYGKLNFIHGDYRDGFLPAFYAKAIAQLYHRNVVFGHFHAAQSAIEVSPIDTHPTIAQGVPCLSHVNPIWMKNRANAWSNGFFTAYVQPNGLFNHQIVNISHNSFIFEGELYK